MVPAASWPSMRMASLLLGRPLTTKALSLENVTPGSRTDDASGFRMLPIVGATTMGNMRNPLASSVLLPGVTFSNDNALVVNGLPSNSEAIRIEGQDAAGTIWKVIQQNSQGGGVDAIQEVSVQTSNFAAEYGQVGGGYFNFTMKSGTNQYHGSVYDYLVNEAFNAGLPYTDA